MWITIAYFLKRAIPLEEAISIPLAFSLYYIGFAFLGYANTSPIGWLDYLAVAIYLLGSYLNTGSEWQRDRWKKRPENKGKLYTVGLFSWSMHINYFGDLLWVTAYAIVTRNAWSILIVLFLFCFFAFFNIPKLDAYLAEKYGEQFDAYQKKTKRLIPFLY